MSRRRQLRVFLLLAALIAIVAVGCAGDDDESDKERASTSAETGPTKKPKVRRGSGKDAAEARRGSKTANRRPSKAELEKERRALRKEAEQDRKEDRKFDRAFRETAFERIVAQLPIRKPPLFVEQYITSEGSSTVYTAVAPKRFFCGRSAARRKAAVRAFYRDADKLFRRRGVKDFVQVVTPIAETTERLPALAIARKGSVSLTKRGRARGRC